MVRTHRCHALLLQLGMIIDAVAGMTAAPGMARVVSGPALMQRSPLMLRARTPPVISMVAESLSRDSEVSRWRSNPGPACILRTHRAPCTHCPRHCAHSWLGAPPLQVSQTVKPVKQGRLNVRIDDAWYDLTNWRKAHPAGSHWIDAYNNTDCTEVM